LPLRANMTPFPGRPLACWLTAILTASLAVGQAGRANVNRAEARFRLGEFTEAEEMTDLVLAADPDNLRAILLQARMALFRNQLDETEALVRRALELRPTYRLPREILAEVEQRRGDFASAAVLHTALGHKVTAAMLASFENRSPYAAGPVLTRIPFAETDPVPILNVRLNGGAPAAFLLDTGTDEVTIDVDWAAQNEIADFGEEKSPGGMSRFHGRADLLAISGFEIQDVPVTLLQEPLPLTTKDGEPLRGVLGVSLLSRFLVTIDYPAGDLVLEPRKPAVETASAPTLLARIPFYLTGEKDIVVQGRVNDADPVLFLIASGHPGLGFTSPRRTLDEGHIELLEEGPELSAAVLPYLLDSLSLGELRRTQFPGVHGLFPTEREHTRGFELGGLVSHGFLRPFAVTFDFDAMEILVRQPAD
jgi:hypothetical protein